MAKRKYTKKVKAKPPEDAPDPLESAPQEPPKKKSGVMDPADLREKPKKVVDPADAIRESRKVLKEPLGEGLQYFESPEGFIVVSEKKRGTVWCQLANGGKGAQINPKR